MYLKTNHCAKQYTRPGGIITQFSIASSHMHVLPNILSEPAPDQVPTKAVGYGPVCPVLAPGPERYHHGRRVILRPELERLVGDECGGVTRRGTATHNVYHLLVTQHEVQTVRCQDQECVDTMFDL